MAWLDETINRNLSWRAEEIMRDIHGLPDEDDEPVPDSPYSFAEVASGALFGGFAKTRVSVWRIG